MLAKSYHAVGIQEVLSKIDVPKGSFYHYFDSKEDFCVAIIKYYGEQLSKSITERLASRNCSPRNRLREYFLAIREYYQKTGYNQGCLVAKLAVEVAHSSPHIRMALKSEFDRWLQLFADCISEAQQQGEIDAGHNPDELAEFIYTSWEGALIRMQVNHDLSSIDNFINYVFRYVIPQSKA